MPTVTGTDGNDTLIGGKAAEVIIGLAGDDVIYGNDGNDIIDGGAGSDQLYGGAGDDTIKSWRHEGPDYIDGGAGIDTLALKRSYEYVVEHIDISTAEKIATPQDLGEGTVIVNMERLNITGGYMGDHFVGGALGDEIHGWNGDDTLEGNGGDDYIDGGAGNDVLIGGSGHNTLIGYSGDDKFVSGPDAVDIIDGGTGNDYLVLDRRAVSADLTLDLSLPAATVQALGDGTTISGIEQIEFYGGSGADTVTGGSNNDAFRGAGGNDRFDGGAGLDMADYVGPFADYAIDRVLGTVASTAEGTDTLVRVEKLHFLDGIYDWETGVFKPFNSTPVLTAGEPSNGLIEAGHNGPGLSTASLQLTASDPDAGDTISYVTDGWTSLGSGQWSLSGVYGTATLNTATGQVAYLLDNNRAATQALAEGAAAQDKFDLTIRDSHGANATQSIEFSIVGADDNIVGATIHGTDGNDIITPGTTVAGQPLVTANDDTIYGAGGSDYIDGDAGADKMIGASGNDTYFIDNAGDRAVETADGGTDTIQATISVDLHDHAFVENLRLKEGAGAIGGTGNDLANLITGNASANVIAGGAGIDSLYGKGGADTFYFNEMGAANKDSIWDFDADDKIKLGSAFAGLDSNHDGILDTDAFMIASKYGATATADHAQLIYNAAIGNLSYDADGAGGQAAQDIVFIGANKAFFDHGDIVLV
jgi:VCBS repeat-containing protein